MWFSKLRNLTVFLVSFMALVLAAANLSAQQTTAISGKITAAYAHQDSIVVGDFPGHVMSLSTSEGTNANSGDNAFMDGAKVVNLSYADLMMGNGSHLGYILFAKNGDTAYSKWEGKITTVLSAKGLPETSFEGTFTYTKGTGTFEKITGNGTYKGTFTSMTEYTVDWQSEYSIGE
jgi:hypothetical protein